MKSQTASEVMELKVGPGAGLRIKIPDVGAVVRRSREDNAVADVFVSKIDIEIGKVQCPMLADAKIDSTATGPSAPDVPAASAERVRECAAKACGLVHRSHLAQFGQASRTAAGAKYHYPITKRMPDADAPGRVPIQGGVGN